LTTGASSAADAEDDDRDERELKGRRDGVELPAVAEQIEHAAFVLDRILGKRNRESVREERVGDRQFSEEVRGSRYGGWLSARSGTEGRLA